VTQPALPPVPPLKRNGIPDDGPRSQAAVPARPRRSPPLPRLAAIVAAAAGLVSIVLVITAITLLRGPAAGPPPTMAVVSPTSARLLATLPAWPTVTPTQTLMRRPTATTLPTREPTPAATLPFMGEPETIGTSVQGRPLVVYRLGGGPIKRALIGAIHGGYEWNTVDLMTKTLDYLRENPNLLPPEVTLYILPIANPDGYAAGTDPIVARMNAHGVDLNRNWDYQWQITATHGTRPVSAGTAPFSEPETVALRDFLVKNEIEAVIFYHSAFSAVFQGAGITTSQTVELAQLIAQATNYRYAPEGVPGQITTGDAIDWLTTNGITAIEVELSSHQAVDWERNLRGLEAFLNWKLPAPAPPGPQASPTVTDRRTYVVQPGDNLSSIAAKFHVSIDAIAQANHITDLNSISVDQVLIIP
jgi:LysM repeat protein